MRIKTVSNVSLNDDSFVEECMQLLVERYPVITGWTFERTDGEHINILMYGDLHMVE